MRRAVSRSLASSLLLVTGTIACSNGPSFPVTPRAPGARTPLTATCSPFDPERCMVPYPASNFMVADATTATGLRVQFDDHVVNTRDDGGERLSHADGFSRVSSLVVSFEETLDEASFGGPRGGVLRLFVATPGAPHYGEEVPLRIETYRDGVRQTTPPPRSVLVGDPLAVLEPETDYLAVVTDDLRAVGGAAPEANRATRVALGLEPPTSTDEAALAGYYVPLLDVLDDVGIEPAHVVRAWDFTTRSIENTTAPLDTMVAATIAAVDAGTITIEWDVVDHRTAGGEIASVLEGRFVGIPNWLDASGALVTDENGIPTQQGTTEAPFRIVVPAGTGDYRAVLYGHGAAGNYHDNSFDATLAGHGVAKVGVQFYGWTDTDLIPTLSALATALLDGAHHAFAPLMQASAHALAIGHALDTILDDALAAPMLDGMTNPNAGRHVDWSQPTWVGGSLGGTMGLVISAQSSDIGIGVLNVPGAAWSHWCFQSTIFETFLAGIASRHGGVSNVVTLIAVAQTIFDGADGVSFADRARTDGDIFLEQESMGDEVLPNPGNEMVAICTGATQVGVPLHPIEGLHQADHVSGATGMTQYRVGDTGLYDVHGFAARNTPAGHAAFDQIQSFLDSAWAGAPEITVPAGCPASGCEFAASP